VTAAEWVTRVGASDEARHDAEAVLARLAQVELFTHDRNIIVARAPGRLDVMGGIADYSGSLVLEWPLADATFVALQKDPHLTLTIVSGPRCAQLALPGLVPLDYGDARAFFARDPTNHWAAYVAGAFIVLAREQGVEFADGARILVTSSVPEGKGVSSSAALEVAAMTAICAAYGITLEPRHLALLCQKVENLIAGAPCGVMDQMTAALGESGQLLAVLCQPAEVRGRLELPRGLAVWGIDSGIRHAVGGAEYGSVRTAAFMGRRILEDLTGRRLDYLANVTPAEFASLAARVPERLTGREFLGRYHAAGDQVTPVDPERLYPVRVATAHPIYEHARVRTFAKQLSPFEDQEALASQSLTASAERLGTLMYESHSSYSACGLGSEGTDALVTFVQRAGPGSGIYGAKITGGGSGGAVAILGNIDAGPLVHAIAARYARRSGHAARVFGGSSSGAAACGVCDLRT
jgi:L-arabinokinase